MEPRPLFKVLYLFSGRRRCTGVAQLLQGWAEHAEFAVEVAEWDISNGSDFDLLQEDNQQRILAAIRDGSYAAVLMSPPCGTWSRAPWANQFGPRPLRSAAHPWGFPWLEGFRQQKVAESNCFIRLCLQVLEILQAHHPQTKFWWEHPEDLGSVLTYRRKARSQWFHKLHHGVRPASIWQLEALRKFKTLPGAFSVAFHQCLFQASSPKPTRIFTNLSHFAVLGKYEWPQIGQEGQYLGPLPRQCQCGRLHRQLIAKDAQGRFRTSEAAAYPPAMDEFIARATWSVLSDLASSPLKRPEGEKKQEKEENWKRQENEENREKKNQENEERRQENEENREKRNQEDEEKRQEKTLEGVLPEAPRGSKRKQEMAEPYSKRARTLPSLEARMLSLPLKAAPLQVWYKGKIRRMSDGLGKCSPGIRPAGSRGPPGSRNATKLGEAFWGEVTSLVDSLSREERLRMIAKISLGKYEASPFGDAIVKMREKLDSVVRGLGKDPSRRRGDRRTEINFRRLAAWSELVGDEGDRYLPSLASKGVPLGARNEIGRVTAAYDPKKREEEDAIPSGWAEDFEQSSRDNYISATAHMDKVKKHISEDVERGWVAAMSLKEAKSRYGEELQVASLGAVPKDQQWSDVRVVHDGTHGIQVNSKIAQPNKMEFPQFDDLQAALGAFQQWDSAQKLLVAFDIKAAHRLIPVQKEDWGLQAFRLDDPEKIYLNQVGTFGITTASFWWGRVASTLFRTFHRVLPRHSLIYFLLFADDGLAMVGGEDYHRLALSIFIYLELMEVPLSWRKTRGGFKTEWIGYSVDLEQGLIGVSDKKVKWLKEWVAATNREGRILGRDFKAGVGRMGFLAGAVRGARPFLAPLYAVAAKVGNTAFVELHMAVKIALEFFSGWLQEEPMKPPCGPPGVAGEVFRVDAMASEQGIMIGGWETFESSNPGTARWFSVELTRKNAPWLYIRGEPHRTIAASELLAVTVAVILFGPAAKWRNKHGRLVLSGFTDNASNSYLIDKYLSVKFPVSMVLMELSRQLAVLGSELQLHWIPREQNEESDNLSKGHYDAFDPKLRLVVDWENAPLLVIPKLVEHAMEFDKEIQLKKSSVSTTSSQRRSCVFGNHGDLKRGAIDGDLTRIPRKEKVET